VSQASYLIGPGDLIDVEVFGEPDLTRQVEVGVSGTINMAFIGQVKVEGLTVDDMAGRLTELYQDGWFNQPQVSVRIAEHRSQKVEVFGVRRPGAYFLRRPTTVLEILGEAGWVDTDTRGRHVVVRRTEGETLIASLDGLMAGEATIGLRGGDVVRIEDSRFVWVGGEVTQAGAIAWSSNLTVSKALLEAGGAKDVAQLRGAYVLRGATKIPVNLRRIEEGREADFAMLPDDRLYVPTSLF